MDTSLSSHVDSQAPIQPISNKRFHWSSWLWIVGNEIYKDLLLRWNYKFDLLTQILLQVCTFIGFAFVHRSGNFDGTGLAPALLGYFVTIYFWQIAASMSEQLREEAETGTLEQMYMSPAAPFFVQMGRSLSGLLIGTIVSLLFALVLIALFQIPISFRPIGIVVGLITVVGVFGFAFIIGGTTLIFKQIDMLVFLFQFALFFFNGTFVTVERLPAWLEAVAKLLPTTQGIIVLRRIVLGGDSLGAVWRDGSLIWLIIHSLICFVIGWLIFVRLETKAKRQGLLGHY